MEQFTYVAPCHFGLEAVLKKEIQQLGYEILAVEDGRVTYLGDAMAIARSNIFIRTAERILLLCGEFTATTFDELFDRTGSFLREVIDPLLEQEKNVLIVGHGAMNLSIISQIRNLPRKEFWSTGIENCRMIRLL